MDDVEAPSHWFWPVHRHWPPESKPWQAKTLMFDRCMWENSWTCIKLIYKSWFPSQPRTGGPHRVIHNYGLRLMILPHIDPMYHHNFRRKSGLQLAGMFTSTWNHRTTEPTDVASSKTGSTSTWMFPRVSPHANGWIPVGIPVYGWVRSQTGSLKGSSITAPFLFRNSETIGQ